MSSLSTEWVIPRYWKERFPLKLFVPVILFLAVPSLLSATGTSRLGALLLLVALVIQFRVLDDLGDLETDRIDFPERVLSRARSLVPFRRLLLTAAAGVVFLLAGQRHLLFVYLVTLAAFLAWYRWLAQRSPPAAVYHVVAFKYPIFVYLAAGLSSVSKGPLLLATMALAYLTFVVYEPLHDGRLHRLCRIAVVVGVDLTVWSATALITLMMARSGGAPPGLVLLIAMAVLAVATASHRRFRREADCTFFGRGIFLVAFLALLSAHGGKVWA